MGNYSYGADDHLDKSALQGLTIDEACWLGTFHQPVITPLFFVETLADLDKEIIKGRSPESIVGNFAGKTPPTGVINVHHKTICEAELIEGFPCPWTVGLWWLGHEQRPDIKKVRSSRYPQKWML